MDDFVEILHQYVCIFMAFWEVVQSLNNDLTVWLNEKKGWRPLTYSLRIYTSLQKWYVLCGEKEQDECEFIVLHSEDHRIQKAKEYKKNIQDNF